MTLLTPSTAEPIAVTQLALPVADPRLAAAEAKLAAAAAEQARIRAEVTRVEVECAYARGELAGFKAAGDILRLTEKSAAAHAAAGKPDLFERIYLWLAGSST